MTAEDRPAPRNEGPPGESRARRRGARRELPEIGGRARILWIILGTFFVVLSVLGALLPGLPGAPFVLLAAFCYLRGSRRLYVWLLEHRLLGKLVEETSTGVGISRKARLATVLFLWVSVATSCIFFLESLPLRLLLIGLGAGVTVFLLRFR